VKIPRDLSGRDFIKVLCRDYGYRQVSQEGSHVILATDTPFPQRIAVPDHKVLRLGTLNGLLRVIAHHKGIDRADLIQSL